MLEPELIESVARLSGASSVLLWNSGTAAVVGFGWDTSSEELVAELRLGRVWRDWGVRDASGGELRALSRFDRARSQTYFVEPASEASPWSVILGFGSQGSALSAEDASALARLVALAAGRHVPSSRGGREFDRESIIDLVAGAAHSVGTPLNVISAQAQMLMAASAPDSPVAEPLATMVRETRKVAETIRRVVAVLEPERATAETSTTRSDLVAQALAFASSLLRRLECRAKWSAEGRDDSTIVVCTPRAVGRLFAVVRAFAVRAGAKGLVLLRPSQNEPASVEVECRSADGRVIEMVVVDLRAAAAGTKASRPLEALKGSTSS